MDDYRNGHPQQNVENIEELTGIAQVAEKTGLINVLQEMDKMESA
jgi:hypothetical protein